MSSENLRGKDQFYQELLPKRDTENSQYVAPANKVRSYHRCKVLLIMAS